MYALSSCEDSVESIFNLIQNHVAVLCQVIYDWRMRFSSLIFSQGIIQTNVSKLHCKRVLFVPTSESVAPFKEKLLDKNSKQNMFWTWSGTWCQWTLEDTFSNVCLAKFRFLFQIHLFLGYTQSWNLFTFFMVLKPNYVFSSKRSVLEFKIEFY